jgi:hypothetical protein
MIVAPVRLLSWCFQYFEILDRLEAFVNGSSNSQVSPFFTVIFNMLKRYVQRETACKIDCRVSTRLFQAPAPGIESVLSSDMVIG